MKDWKHRTSLELQKGMSGVFLASETDREAPSVSFYPFDNLQKLEGVYENQSYIKYWYDFDDDIMKAADLSTMFYSIPDLYAFAQSITGQPIQDCNPNISFDRRGMVTSDKIYDIRYYLKVVVLPSSEKLQKIAERDAIRSASSHTNTILAGNLQYNFSNDNVVSVITGTDTFKYVDFKIDLADDLPGKYLHFADFDIRYSGQAFGTNIDNVLGAVQIFRGDVFSNVTAYQDPLSNNTAVDTVLNVFVLPQQPYQNKRDLASSPEHALTVRFRLNVCELPDSINFDVYRSFSYSDTPSDPFGYQYSNTQNNNGFQLPPCNVQIDTFEIHPVQDINFSSQWIRGGVEDSLVIRGSGFGNTKGLSTVMFKNANDGGQTEVGCLNRDFDRNNDITTIELWSDSLITVVFPAKSRKVNPTTNVTLLTGDNWGVLGGGTFRIVKHDPVTNTYTQQTSSKKLEVKYNVDTKSDTYEDTRYSLSTSIIEDSALYNGDSVRVFIFDNSVNNYSKAQEFKDCFVKAVKEWSCVTGVKWRVRQDTFSVNSDLAMDGHNIICIRQDSAIARTFNQSIDCLSERTVIETDMRFNALDTADWIFDTLMTSTIPFGKIDIYYAMLHELGHGHQLNHVVDTSDLMFFTYLSGVQGLPSNRHHLLGYDASVKGGINIMMYNQMSLWDTDCTILGGYKPIGKQLCYASFNPIMQTNTYPAIDLFVYPNPSIQSPIFLQISNPMPSKNIRIEVFDILGKKVHTQMLDNLSQGNHTLSINLPSMISGVYFVRLESKGVTVSSKFIKL